MMRRLAQYNDTDNKWVTISKIVVPTQEDKDQLLLASRYIHNLRNIDTDINGANVLAHLYHNPDLIVVEPKHE
jgi:hypothetical protein